MAWSVTRHDVIKRLLTDPRLSKNPRTSWPAWIRGEIPADWPLISWVAVESMFTADGPEHTRLRSLVSKAFTPRRIAALADPIQAIVDRLLDDLATTAAGTVVDLRARFAYPLPTTLICDLFGVPGTDRPEVCRVIDAVLDTAATPAQAQANAHDLYAAMHQLIATKRAQGGDDLTTALIAAQDQDSRLTETELVSTLILMIGAGSETTVNLISSAVAALLSHPDQLQLLLTGQVGVDQIVEETLRHHAPIMHLPLHYATADIDLDGALIRQGDPVLIGYGAAGRDPDLHGENTDVFDPGRPSTEHLAFGHGPHFCMGAPLARLEADIALRSLFSRFPDLTLAVPADQLRPQASFIANGHQELPAMLHGGQPTPLAA
ncbi:cytochrome P450 family protein [Peterkaempfera bronchialis]|uniref:cytochrome P450 family protein n=1 Tax=Peterkaempfera bronchialis TaxID=2126346 RepID=UPI003C2C397F